MFLKKNTAGQVVCFCLVNASTGAALASATVSVRRCIDGTFAAAGGTVTEDSGGLYKFAPSQADTNGDQIAYYFTATSAVPVCLNLRATAADLSDSVRLGLTALPNAAASAVGGLPVAVDTSGRVDVLKINGTSQTARDLGASVLLSSGTGTGQVKLSSGYVAPNWGDVGSPTTTVNLSGTTIATTQKVDVETIKTQAVTCSGGVTIPANATLASTTNITAGTITTVTNLTNLPAITTDWITAAGVSAGAVTKIQAGLSTYAGGDTSGTTTLLSRLSSARAGYLDNLSAGAVALASGVVVTTNNDKTGYALTQSFPANFADLSITATTGRVTVGTNNDKTGYSISGTKTTLDALQDLSAAQVNAECDTALADYDGPTNAEMVARTLASASYATASGLSSLQSHGDSAWATATGFSTHSAADVWAVATRVLTAGTNITLAKGTGVTGFNDLDAAGVRSAVGLGSANLDTQLAAIAGYIDTEVAALVTSVGAGLGALVSGVKVTTDRLADTLELDGSVYRFTSNALEQAPAGGGGAGLDAQEVRDAMTLAPSAGSPAAGSIDALLASLRALLTAAGVEVTVSSPLADESGVIQVIIGDDYHSADGRDVRFPVTTQMDLTDPSVSVVLCVYLGYLETAGLAVGGQIACTVTLLDPDAGTYLVSADVPSSVTAQLRRGVAHKYEVKLNSPRKVTLARGYFAPKD